jgi:hypothetical protein
MLEEQQAAEDEKQTVREQTGRTKENQQERR